MEKRRYIDWHGSKMSDAYCIQWSISLYLRSPCDLTLALYLMANWDQSTGIHNIFHPVWLQPELCPVPNWVIWGFGSGLMLLLLQVLILLWSQLSHEGPRVIGCSGRIKGRISRGIYCIPAVQRVHSVQQLSHMDSTGCFPQSARLELRIYKVKETQKPKS